MAHTPGPWAKNGLNVEGLVDPDNSQTYVAPICVVDADWREDVRQANQSLIAAAPDLLAALKGMVALIRTGYGCFDAVPEWHAATDAINKAEGKVK